MEITNELRAAAFAAYWGCKAAQYFYGIDPVIGEIVSVEQDRCVVKDDIDRRSWCYLPICKLQLHRLSDITDEHAIEVANILYEGMTDEKSNPIGYAMQFHGTKEFVSALSKTNMIGSKYIAIIDYLRSKGYALPFRGIDLIESGIAEYVK